MLSENCLVTFTSLGGYDGGYLDSILEFEPSTRKWSVVDQMMSARYDNAVSVISNISIKINMLSMSHLVNSGPRLLIFPRQVLYISRTTWTRAKKVDML